MHGAMLLLQLMLELSTVSEQQFAAPPGNVLQPFPPHCPHDIGQQTGHVFSEKLAMRPFEQ